jgi:hypothetical protein
VIVILEGSFCVRTTGRAPLVVSAVGMSCRMLGRGYWSILLIAGRTAQLSPEL